MPVPLGAPDVMLPIRLLSECHGLERGTRGVLVAARLKPGVTIAAAQRDLSAIAKRLEAAYPATNAGTGAEVHVAARAARGADARNDLLIILAAVAVVLLIACANVANLQLARGAARIRELSVRAALGAESRARRATAAHREHSLIAPRRRAGAGAGGRHDEGARRR